MNADRIATFRNFRATDAGSVANLFRTIYGPHYVNPDIYRPQAVVRHHSARRWYAVLAEVGDQCIGHAALCRPSSASTHAELALLAVHPEWRGHGIATTLARHLLQAARSLNMRGVEIKQVSSHDYSQRLAATLGLATVAVLPDYVVSPYAPSARESILVGYATFVANPIPALDWPDCWRPWIHPIEARFGTRPPFTILPSPLPWSITRVMNRVDVTVDRLTEDRLATLMRLPRELQYLTCRCVRPPLPRCWHCGLVAFARLGWFRLKTVTGASGWCAVIGTTT
ncbi:GNAT family N-acetyltransferase [Burkholderia stagnalis]